MPVLNSIFAMQVAFFVQNAVHCLRLDLSQKAERPGLVSAETSGGKITRVSHWEPLDGCGDGKLGNLGR